MYFVKVSITERKVVCVVKSKGHICLFEIVHQDFSVFLVTWFKPNLFLVQTQTLGTFHVLLYSHKLLIFEAEWIVFQSLLCVFENWRSFFLIVTVFVLKTSVFSHPVLFFMSEFYRKLLGFLAGWKSSVMCWWSNGQRGLWGRGEDERAWTASGRMTPDDLQIFNILISISVQARFELCQFLHFYSIKSRETEIASSKTADYSCFWNDYFFMAMCYRATQGDWRFHGYPITLIRPL